MTFSNSPPPCAPYAPWRPPASLRADLLRCFELPLLPTWFPQTQKYMPLRRHPSADSPGRAGPWPGLAACRPSLSLFCLSAPSLRPHSCCCHARTSSPYDYAQGGLRRPLSAHGLSSPGTPPPLPRPLSGHAHKCTPHARLRGPLPIVVRKLVGSVVLPGR